MRELSAAAWLAMVALLAAPGSSAAQVRLKVIGADETRGTARAIVVESGALVHTALLLPEDPEGRLKGEGDVRLQASHVLDESADGARRGPDELRASGAPARVPRPTRPPHR